jgi:SHS2 domain-containing protein
MNKVQAGYQEIEHTADWQLEAWAPDLAGLFEQAAAGMYSLAGVQLQPGPRAQRSLRIERVDREQLLVAFLRELLYLDEREHLAFDQIRLHIHGNLLEADLSGAPIASQDKEIKAVTYHNLVVQSDEEGLRVNVVFDV